MPIKGILFDFGGVICRTEDRNPRLNLAKKLGIPIEVVEQLVFSSPSAKMAEVGKISASQHWQEVARALHRPVEEIPNLRLQFFDGDRIDRELLENIKSMRGDYRTALLSNAFDDLRGEFSESFFTSNVYHLSDTRQITDAFDEIIISAEVGYAKPDCRIYLHAAEKLHVPIEECVFIDDFPRNVEGARLAGMKAILFFNSAQTRQDLESILNANNNKSLRD